MEEAGRHGKVMVHYKGQLQSGTSSTGQRFKGFVIESMINYTIGIPGRESKEKRIRIPLLACPNI